MRRLFSDAMRRSSFLYATEIAPVGTRCKGVPNRTFAPASRELRALRRLVHRSVSPALRRQTAAFIRVNQYITAVWGLAFFPSALVSIYRHVTGDMSLASRYAWVLLSMAAAFFTVCFPDWYRARANASHSATPPD